MRGPMLRIQLDIRRTWKCPECGYERRAHADQTAIRCHCQKEGPFMKLVEEKRKQRHVPEELPMYFELDEAELAEEPTESATGAEEAAEESETDVTAVAVDSDESEVESVEPDAESELEESEENQ